MITRFLHQQWLSSGKSWGVPMPWFGNPGIKPRKTWIRLAAHAVLGCFFFFGGRNKWWVLTLESGCFGGERWCIYIHLYIAYKLKNDYNSPTVTKRRRFSFGLKPFGGVMYISHTPNKRTNGIDCLNKNGMEKYVEVHIFLRKLVVSPIRQADH